MAWLSPSDLGETVAVSSAVSSCPPYSEDRMVPGASTSWAVLGPGTEWVNVLFLLLASSVTLARRARFSGLRFLICEWGDPRLTGADQKDNPGEEFEWQPAQWKCSTVFKITQ